MSKYVALAISKDFWMFVWVELRYLFCEPSPATFV